jgi:hypothetical protein
MMLAEKFGVHEIMQTAVRYKVKTVPACARDQAHQNMLNLAKKSTAP